MHMQQDQAATIGWVEAKHRHRLHSLPTIPGNIQSMVCTLRTAIWWLATLDGHSILNHFLVVDIPEGKHSPCAGRATGQPSSCTLASTTHASNLATAHLSVRFKQRGSMAKSPSSSSVPPLSRLWRKCSATVAKALWILSIRLLAHYGIQILT